MSNRKSVAALAIITAAEGFLLRYNKKSGAYFFIGGHVEGRETFKQCLIREIHEETNFDVNHYHLLASTNVKFTQESKSTGVMTDYDICLFQCELVDPSVIRIIEKDDRLAWVSMDEILSGETKDGKKVSEDINYIMNLDVQDVQKAAPIIDSVEDKADEWIRDHFEKHFELLYPAFKADIKRSIISLLKRQDKDTRQACAESVLNCTEVCETPTGGSAISPDDAHNACINTKAV